MQRSKKRAVSALLATLLLATLIAALPMTASAAVTATYRLYLGDDGLFYENDVYGTDITAEMASEGAVVTGSAGDWILTLTNFDFSSSASTALSLPGGMTLTIVLIGTNAVTSTFNGHDNTAGIWVRDFDGDVTITSSTGGSLSLAAGDATIDGGSAGIIAYETLTINGNANVTATGGYAPNMGSEGINTGNLIINESANVTATGGIGVKASLGIVAHDYIIIGGSANVTAAGGEAPYSNGIFGARSITVGDSATVSGIGGTATDSSTGIYLNDSLSISENASVTVSGGTAGGASGGESIGLNFSVTKINMTGGSLTASGNDSAISKITAPTTGKDYTVPDGHLYWVNTSNADPGGSGTESDGSFVVERLTYKFVRLEYGTPTPKLTAGAVNRTSNSNATVKFTSNIAGNFYYRVDGIVPDEGELIDIEENETAMVAGVNTITLSGLSAGVHTIYIEAFGNDKESNLLTIIIPAFTPGSSSSSSSSSTSTVPKTGDDTNMTSWGVALALSVMCVCALPVAKKRFTK